MGGIDDGEMWLRLATSPGAGRVARDAIQQGRSPVKAVAEYADKLLAQYRDRFVVRYHVAAVEWCEDEECDE